MKHLIIKTWWNKVAVICMVSYIKAYNVTDYKSVSPDPGSSFFQFRPTVNVLGLH